MNIQSKAGEAFITLETGLGKAPPIHHHLHQTPTIQPKPSRLRRTLRQAEARSKAEQAVKESRTSEEENLERDAENVSAVNKNKRNFR